MSVLIIFYELKIVELEWYSLYLIYVLHTLSFEKHDSSLYLLKHAIYKAFSAHFIRDVLIKTVADKDVRVFNILGVNGWTIHHVDVCS